MINLMGFVCVFGFGFFATLVITAIATWVSYKAIAVVQLLQLIL
jgi:hypothetical protein